LKQGRGHSARSKWRKLCNRETSLPESQVSRSFIFPKGGLGEDFHDPRIGIQHLIDTGKIAADELEDLNQLCSDLKQERFEVPRKLVRRPASEVTTEPEIQERA
jgi:hypothetical protein